MLKKLNYHGSGQARALSRHRANSPLRLQWGANSGHGRRTLAPHLLADSVCLMSARPVGLLFGRDTITVPDMRTKYDFHLADLGFGFLPTAGVAADVAV